MDSPFPFGFPGPTIFYFVLFTLTWAIRTAPSTTCWPAPAGSCTPAPAGVPTRSRAKAARPCCCATGCADARRGDHGRRGPSCSSILFRRSSTRRRCCSGFSGPSWGRALILGFYLLYVHKERLLCERATWLQTLNAVVCATCFAFPAICWTANFIMSVNPSLWPQYYTGEAAVFATFAYALRLGSWFAAASADVGHDHRRQVVGRWGRRARSEPSLRRRRRAAATPRPWQLGGLIAATLLGAALHRAARRLGARAHLRAMGGPWLLLGAIGVGLEGFAWSKLRQSDGWNRLGLTLASVGAVCTLLGARPGCARRSAGPRWPPIRKSTCKCCTTSTATASASGQPLFFTFVAINLGLGIYCVWLVSPGEPR